MSSCPLTYDSGNASQKRDVLGTWFPSILAGHQRHSHVTGLRGEPSQQPSPVAGDPGDGAVIPRPGRCGERLRRTEEPMGLGRLCHSGHRTLPDQRPSRGADLQLAELALSRGQTGGQDGGHRQPGVAAGSRGPIHQAGGENHALPDADARGQVAPYAADRRYPSGSELCKKSRAAVPDGRQMEATCWTALRRESSLANTIKLLGTCARLGGQLPFVG